MARLADAWSQAQKEEGGGSWRVLEQAVRESLAIVARAPVAEPNAMTEAEKYAQAQGLAQWMADNPLPATVSSTMSVCLYGCDGHMFICKVVCLCC
jgi:hypothetical protein